MNPTEQFKKEVQQNITDLGADSTMQQLGFDFVEKTAPYKYSYNFTWMGRPVIQFPQDMIALQEIIWNTRPDLIIETGIAHGGSIIFSASMLELLGQDGIVLGLDIDIREHNRIEIEKHPMHKRIKMIQGSSIDPAVIAQVHELAKGKKSVLVILDSNHTHEHVIGELNAYAPLVTPGNYCVVYDTIVEDMPDELHASKPWSKGNNPKTAVREFLKTHPEFEVDKAIQNKILITVGPDGYLKRIK